MLITALLDRCELAVLKLLEAGVEPENVAGRGCLERAGFGMLSPESDCEGMLYYRAARAAEAPG